MSPGASALDALGGSELTSAAFVDNPASLAVSRKVGYCPHGLLRVGAALGEGSAGAEAGADARDFPQTSRYRRSHLTALERFLKMA